MRAVWGLEEPRGIWQHVCWSRAGRWRLLSSSLLVLRRYLGLGAAAPRVQL